MFESANLKVQRGLQSLNAFSEAMNSYRGSSPASYHTESRGPIVYIALVLNKQISPAALVIAGEAAHSFRCALDHCIWSLKENKEIHPPNERQLYFPIGTAKIDFEKKITDLKFVDSNLEQYFLGLECFPGGKGQLIEFLHRVDIVDKHRLITPAFAKVTATGMTKRTKFLQEDRLEKLPDQILHVSSSVGPVYNTAAQQHHGFAKIIEYAKDGFWHIEDYGTVDIEIGFSDPQSPIDGTMLDILRMIASQVAAIIQTIDRTVTQRDQSCP